MSKINLATAENFNDIADYKLQTYNRAMMSLNILESNGEADVREYFSQFSEKDYMALAAMLIAIKRNPEEVRRGVILNVIPTE